MLPLSPNRRASWYEDGIVGWQAAVDEFNPNRGRGNGRRRVSCGRRGARMQKERGRNRGGLFPIQLPAI
jgi:hypothetical protein